METITKALVRARQSVSIPDIAQPFADSFRSSRPLRPKPPQLRPTHAVPLDESHLRRNHVITFDPVAAPTRHYDLLRRQLARHAHHAPPLIVCVSAPGHGCGTTTTAINLAFSFARGRGERVVLADAHAGATEIRNRLGLPQHFWHEGPLAVEDETVTASLQSSSLRVADLRATDDPITEARRRFEDATVVVIDLPPLLGGDSASGSLNSAPDAIVVVLAEGRTTLSEVEQAKSLLDRREGVQFVLNGCGFHGL